VLLGPNAELSGYIELHGSADQLAALRENDEYRRILADASLAVDGLRQIDGFANDAFAGQIAIYQESIAWVPQAV
jgi:hypothetical protein